MALSCRKACSFCASCGATSRQFCAYLAAPFTMSRRWLNLEGHTRTVHRLSKERNDDFSGMEIVFLGTAAGGPQATRGTCGTSVPATLKQFVKTASAQVRDRSSPRRTLAAWGAHLAIRLRRRDTETAFIQHLVSLSNREDLRVAHARRPRLGPAIRDRVDLA